MSHQPLPSNVESVEASPFIKWAGGKHSLLAQFAPHFPPSSSYQRYFEPFVGSAAVFFHLQPTNGYLLDVNPRLIEVYQIVRDDVEELIQQLKQHRNDKDYFYAVRAQDEIALSAVQRAARFIFLNKTCYNGLYRVNRQGQFNVPYGRYKNPRICDESGLRAANRALQNTQLKVADFEVLLNLAQPGDLVYFDPPYEPLSATSSFTSYTTGGFSSEDQRRLAAVFRTLDSRGCLLMLSNSSAPLIYQLYQGYHIHNISARRAINSKPDGRGVILELLVTNFGRTESLSPPARKGEH